MPGMHTLSVVVGDDSGNETQKDVTGTVASVVETDVFFPTDATSHENHFSLTAGVTRTFTIRLEPAQTEEYMGFWNPGSCVNATYCGPQGPTEFTVNLTDQSGNAVPLTVANTTGYDFNERYGAGATLLPAGVYTLTVMPSADTQISIYGYRD